MFKSLLVVATFFILQMPSNAQSTSELTIKSGETLHSFTVEIADTDDLRRLGLMNRETLDENAGMLFDYEQSQSVNMWMKNTLLSLDMLFIDEAGQVLGIARNAAPHSERRIGIGAPVRAVLELNAGSAAKLGINPGDTVVHTLFNNTDILANPSP